MFHQGSFDARLYQRRCTVIKRTLFLFLLSCVPAVAQQGQAIGPTAPCSAFGTASGTCLQGAGALGSPLSIGTLPAFTLGGTISGGGNNVNNVNINVSSPGTGAFTTIGATSVVTINANTAAGPTPLAGDVFRILQADSVVNRTTLESAGATNIIGGRRSGGTMASPAATPAAVSLLQLGGLGYTTGYATGPNALISLQSNTLWTTSNADTRIAFSTTPTGTLSQVEALRIQPSGGVSIGATSIASDPGIGSLNMDGTIIAPNITSDAGLADTTLCWKNAATTGTFLKGSGTLGICLGTSGAQFKTAFAPMVGGLEEVMGLSLQNYRYRNGYGDSGERMQYGLTAQDVDKVMPDLVRRDTSGEVINYDSGALLFVGLRAIQQLKTDNDNLRACQATWKCRIFGVQ